MPKVAGSKARMPQSGDIKLVSLPAYIKEHVHVEGGCWLWNRKGPLTVRDPNHGGRETPIRRLLYGHYFGSAGKQPLVVTCNTRVSNECINPNHIRPWSLLTTEQRVAAVYNEHVAEELEDGVEHWLWRGKDDRLRLYVDGKNVQARVWLYRAVYPKKLTNRQKLVQREGRCQFLRCVNPQCFVPEQKFSHLYRVEDKGYRSLCHIGRKPSKKTGYVPYGGNTLHKRRYEYVYGRVPQGLELHHLCGQRPCCNPEHLKPMTLEEHQAVKEGREEEYGPVPKSILKRRRESKGLSSAEHDALNDSFTGDYDEAAMNEMLAFVREHRKRGKA